SAEERQTTIFRGGGTRTAFRRILRDGAGFAWLKRTDLGLGQIIEDIREGLRLSTKFRPYRFQWSPSNNKNPFRDFFSIGIYYPEKEKDQFEMISKLSSISNTIKWAEEKKKEKGDYKLALRVNVPKLDFEGNEAIQDYAPFRQERISEKELVEEGDKFNHIQPSLKIHKYKPTEKKDRTSDINKIKIEKNKGFATETIEGKIKTKFYDKDNQDNMDAKTYLDKAIKNCKDKLDKISNQLKEEKFDAINSEYERYLSGVTGVQKRDFEEFEKSLKKIKKIKKEYEYFREKKGETLGKLRFLEREKNRYEFISEVDSWYLENKKDQNDDPKDSKQNKLKDLGERKNILAKGWENFLNYLNGEGGVSKSPTGPYYEIRMSNTMKRRLKAGAEVQAISILPPIPGKLSCTLSIHLKAKESIFKQRKNLIPSFNTISFEGEHAKKDVYHGLDINAMTSKTVLDNAFIDVSNVRPYLNASDSEEKKKEKASIPLPNETHQTSPIEIDFEIEDLKKDIAKMWGIKYESTDGDNGPFSNWWEKIETNFLGLNSESEPESENLNPYKTEDRRKKSLSELTFNEILMAPVAYTHRGRQHNMDHILNLKKAIGRERRKIKSNPDRPLTRLNRLQTEHYFRNRSYESKRDHMILYMAKVIAYLLSHGLSSSFAYEDLKSLSTKGRTGFGAGIVNGMIKGYGKLEEVVKWIMTTWGTRDKLEDVQLSAVNPGYTSRYHFTCTHLLRLYRKKLSNALGKRGSSIHFTNKMKQKLMAKGIPHKLSLSSVDRNAGADYGVCYFCSYLDKRRNSPREERGEEKKEDVKGRDKVSLPRSEAIFNAQNQAAANIAFRLFLKDATIT
ncbi:MAG TPA: hypothetical protein VKO42_00790, partial [Patescibacteria group bacterium]|nr:hypothetical protein [Patescibacteria group bacterium]